ncbi:MAG TPA: ABC transporter substrate-binding protein [Stellaceae bacterium]|nr:ABC transporter substrate-binding protein [Stellaceae bacterium]
MPSVPRRTLFIGLIALGLMTPSLAVPADTGSGASQFVGNLVNSALQVLADRKAAAAAREQTFERLLSENFDVPRIARFVLGRYWTTASDQDRRKFIDTYREFIIRTYAARFSEYSGETVKVTSSRPEGANYTVVNSEIIHPNGDPPVKVSWRVRQSGDSYKIVDVDVEGVSMMLTQREEFTSVIQRTGGTVGGLIQAIQQKLQSGDLSLGG